MTTPDLPERQAQEWLAAFAARLGVPAPDADTVDILLELAGVAAHASERKAAPIACWMVAASGTDARHALSIAQEI